MMLIMETKLLLEMQTKIWEIKQEHKEKFNKAELGQMYWLKIVREEVSSKNLHNKYYPNEIFYRFVLLLKI